MAARIAVVAALVVLSASQSLTSFAASRTPDSRHAFASRGALSFSRAAAAATKTHGPASRVSVPDGAGGLYIAWPEIRDGSVDIFLLRVTNAGAIAPGWPADGLTVCSAPGDQFLPTLLPDSQDGVLVGWYDFRAGWSTPDGWAQRVSNIGVIQFPLNGVKVVDDLFSDVSVAPDGTGGLLVAWSGMGALDLDIFAKRYDGTGALVTGWSATGVLVCGLAEDQVSPEVIHDGGGGAIIAWEDGRAGLGETHVYAQRLNGSGVEQWTANGNQIDAAVLSSAGIPVLCSDGGTGALVFWYDFSSSDAIVGQRVNSAGVVQWAPGGIGVSGAGLFNTELLCLPDGLGGAIVTWDESPGGVRSLRAQRVNSAGAAQWGVGGASIVSIASSDPLLTDVVPAAAGAAYFIWEDSRAGGSVYDLPNVYAQSITSGGAVTGGWTANGVAVCTASGMQGTPTGAPDGSGGLLVAWLDQGNFYTNVYAQRYSSAGVAQFTADGLTVFNNPGMQVGEFIIQTDQGGAFVFYNEKRSGQWDIRARKFDADGTPAGAAVVICSAVGHQELRAAIDDGAGGAIVAWTDLRSGEHDIYVQRVDIDCAPQWTANGVPICIASGRQELPRMVSDGAGGAILAWQDDRNANNTDVYAQRVIAAGTALWTPNGVAVCADAGVQQYAVLASDGAGGAIVAWLDLRSILAPSVFAQRLDGSGVGQWTPDGHSIAVFGIGSIVRVSDAVTGLANDAIVLISEPVFDFLTGTVTSVLHAQKVNSAGAPQWGAAGATVCDVSSFCLHEHIVNDGAGGAYVAWSDGRDDVFDIYMQRLDATGTPQWTVNGNAVCTATSWQLLDGLMRDTAGDAYLAWADQRDGQPDIYAQRFDATGAAQWTPNGVVVTSATRGQYSASIAPWKTAAPGRVFVAWTDNRVGDTRYVFLQRLDTAGATQWASDATTPTTLAMASVSAEPDRVRLTWYASAYVVATVYRSGADRDWLPVGEVSSNGTGLITFEDRDIVPGERYGYQLGFIEDGREIMAGEVWVEVPTGLHLALGGLRPNPAEDELVVSFTLPTDDAATIELIDVAGRRVFARELAGLPAGRHTLRLDQAKPTAGVYFIRLTQRERSITTRAAVLR